MFLLAVVTCRICLIDYLRLIIFLHVIAPRPVMCSFMLICQCCFAIVKVLFNKVTYLLTYCIGHMMLVAKDIDNSLKTEGTGWRFFAQKVRHSKCRSQPRNVRPILNRNKQDSLILVFLVNF